MYFVILEVLNRTQDIMYMYVCITNSLTNLLPPPLPLSYIDNNTGAADIKWPDDSRHP